MEMPKRAVYTIGHSNQRIDEFVALLDKFGIQTLVDVRSRPRSRFPWFNQLKLRETMLDHGIKYLHLGEELGGYPDGQKFYTDDRVIYQRVAATDTFRRGIRQVTNLANETRLVLMCSQAKPIECHRHPLLARALVEKQVEVHHILKDGSHVNAKALFSTQTDGQMPLFTIAGEDFSWKSPTQVK